MDRGSSRFFNTALWDFRIIQCVEKINFFFHNEKLNIIIENIKFKIYALRIIKTR